MKYISTSHTKSNTPKLLLKTQSQHHLNFLAARGPHTQILLSHICVIWRVGVELTYNNDDRGEKHTVVPSPGPTQLVLLNPAPNIGSALDQLSSPSRLERCQCPPTDEDMHGSFASATCGIAYTSIYCTTSLHPSLLNICKFPTGPRK